jgi:hypothetical protein
MQRPKEHVTDDKGDALLRAALVEWAVNRIEKDYGSDYGVDVFREGKATGLKLNGQLKSSTVTAYSADGRFISEKLDVEAAEYLAQCLQQPTFLFHADVEKGQIYWSAIQLDAAVRDSLEKRKTKSLTVRIPTANMLPQQWERFLQDLDAAQMTVLRRGLLLADHTDFVEAMRNQPLNKQDELADDLTEKAYRLRLVAAHNLVRAGDHAESKRRLLQVLGSSDISIYIRFNGTLQLGDVEWTEIMRSKQPQIRASEQLLKTGQDLWDIAKKGPKHLKLLALMARASGELSIIIQRHHGLSMSWTGHRTSGRDPLWMAVLTSRLNENFVSLRRKYNQCLRLVRIAARSPRRLVMGASIVKLVRQIPTVLAIFTSSGFLELAEQYRQSAYQLLRMAAALATESNDDDDMLSVTMLALQIDLLGDGEISKWSHTLAERWPLGNEYRAVADQFASNIEQRKRGIRLDGDIVTTERQVMENVLSGYGYDPSSSPWPELIDLAVKDHDLGRALKDCEHTFITPGDMPEILRHVGLELAGPKVLHCTLYGHKVENKELDAANAEFTSKYCNTCKDKSPRPADWVYDHHFQDAENKRWANKDF